MLEPDETFVPHIGWLAHEHDDDVARYLREGWFEFAEQALFWLCLRTGDVVVDCGAHVGLFTLLASHAVGEYGRVLALEPNATTATLLRRNLAACGARNAEVIEAVAASTSGTLTLHAGAGAAAAYSSAVVGVVEQASDVQVRATTIDDVLRERNIDAVNLLKIDVEGAELDVWRGCAQIAASDRLSLVMVELTEANQRAAGLSSADLIRAWADAGYAFHRFNIETLQLRPAVIDGPIEYENLFASRDVGPINQRLHEASPQRKRLAHDVLVRGNAAHALLKRACDGEHYRHLIEETNSVVSTLKADLAEVNRRLIEAIKRGDLAEEQVILLRKRVQAYAQFIHQTTNSRPLRLLYALRLTQRPAFEQQVLDDLP